MLRRISHLFRIILIVSLIRDQSGLSIIIWFTFIYMKQYNVLFTKYMCTLIVFNIIITSFVIFP